MIKNLGIALLVNILWLGLAGNCASIFGDIPRTTLQIAREFGSNPYLQTPPSKIVRVGLGSNNFSTYMWDKASIYGTGEFEVYNNNNYIDTYDSENVVNVSLADKIFVLTDAEDNVIAKISGPIIFKTDFGFLGVKGLKRAGIDAVYRGQLEMTASPNDGKFYIINALELEDYLKGVVPNEMPVHFGLEALKAQSVAARNYVLSPRSKLNPYYDVVDSVASQVYFGANTEKELSNRAVNETTGIVALYGWDLILAQYSSTAGGYTESYENAFSDPITKKFPSDPKPYLSAKPDYDDIEPLDNEESAAKFYKSKPKSFDEDSTYFRWEREWIGPEIQDAVQSNIAVMSVSGFVTPAVRKDEIIGLVKKINVTKRGKSGKIMELEVQTDGGNYLVRKELIIRRLLTNKGRALPSANMVFEHEYDQYGTLIHLKAYGGGFGHGVGMSQYGAGYMCKKLGKTFEQILKHYYSGIVLATEPVILSSDASQNSITQNFYTGNGKGILVVDNKYKVSYIDVSINNVDEKFTLDTAQRYNQIDLSKYLVKGMNAVTFHYPQRQGMNKGMRLYIELAGEDGRNK